MNSVLRLATGTGLALLLAACASGPQPSSPSSGSSSGQTSGGGGYYQNDGPPDDENIDLAAIPDAVPVDEPPSRYGNPDSYSALGQTYYVMPDAAGFTQTGRASWYGRQFHGRRTSSGEPYNMYKMTAAHKRLPIPSYVRVTNRNNHKQVIVRVNDRGPFHDGRIIDLSYVAARRLGIVARGSAPVEIETVTPATLRADRNAESKSAAPESPDDSQQPSRVRRVARQPAPATKQPRAVQVADHGGSRSSSGDLFLQSGAFSQRANARTLRKRLQRAGFKRVVIADPIDAKPLYRVRVGPFSNPRNRDQVRQALTNRGFAAREVAR